MGEVHLARRDAADHVCVLKLLRMEYRSNRSLLSRLKREAHLLTYLDHPNVSRILDAGVESGIFYLALEHIDGHTLRSIFKRCLLDGRTMPPGAALAIALAVLAGLEHAHALRGPEGEPLDIVHRDLSPNNIMLSRSGLVKIIDFGLAAAKVDRFQTTPGVVLGTFRYTAPEQIEGGQTDRRSDLYAVGAILYEALTGVPVVATRDPKEVLHAVLTAQPRPFREVAPHLPEPLWDAVRTALAKDPEQRPQDSRAFAESLSSASGGIAVLSPAELARTIAELFSISSSAETLTPVDAASFDTTASEASRPEVIPRSQDGESGEASGAVHTDSMPTARPVGKRRGRSMVGWMVPIVASVAMLLISFAGVLHLAGRGSSGSEAMATDLEGFHHHVQDLLAQHRWDEAARAMRSRAEDRLESTDALAIQRALFDAGELDGESLKPILERQVALELRAVARRR